MDEVPDYLKDDKCNPYRGYLKKRKEEWARQDRIDTALALVGIILGIVALALMFAQYVEAPNIEPETLLAEEQVEVADYVIPDPCELAVVECDNVEEVEAHVTGYNTVVAQTDSTPCIAASGDNICGRDDVVACPTNVPLYTKVEIEGKQYTCLDRTAGKYDGRYDISCDKDFECPREVTGVKQVLVYRD